MERRSAPRYGLVAEAEVCEIHSGTKLKAKTADLSMGGCFLDTLNPSSEGVEVRVTILREGCTFTATGRVMFAFTNLGMGIGFTRVDDKDLETLKKWINELNRNPNGNS